MGLFDFWRDWRKQKEGERYAQMLNGTVPIFSQFGDDIFMSDVVQQCAYCIVTEMKKLNPRHVRKSGLDLGPVMDSTVQKVLDNPNPLMTRSDMLEKITYSVLANYNAFVYMERDASGRLAALWPIAPTKVTFLEDSRGKLFLDLLFANGYGYILPYDSVIHIRTHYNVNDYMGGDEYGQPDNAALLDTLSLNHVMMQGVQKALKSSFAINGVVKYNTLLDDGKIAQSIAEFEQRLANSQSGILGIDNKAEIVQFKRDIKLVDADTLKFVDDKILRHFGVPLAILEGDYSTETYEAFYNRTLEPLIINFSEAFTKGIFSQHQIQGYDNRIYFYPKELIFMSTAQVLQMVHELGQTGTLYENEKRVAFGLEPLEELRGVRLMSLNYVNAEDAREYQLGRVPSGDDGSTTTNDDVQLIIDDNGGDAV
jgi:HK97 family phage portal protein